MRKLQLIFALIIVIIISGCATTGTVKPIEKARDISEEKIARDMSVRPEFHTNKKLTYSVAWNGIPVGYVDAEAGDIIDYRGRDVYVVKVTTRSNEFLSRIYRVEDVYTSYVDTEKMTSMRYEADRKEGNYRKHVIVEYDFDELEATYTNLTDGSVKKCAIKKDVQDPVSALCYFMTLPVKLDDEINITVNLNEKNYELFGKVESIDLIRLPRLGSFPAFKIRPYAVLKGERFKKGSGWMYFMVDRKRFPIYGVVWIPFGKVTSTLISLEDM